MMPLEPVLPGREAIVGEQAAEAATAVVSEMLRVTDAAKKDPGARDWESEIRRYAGDPAALLAVTAVRDYATIGTSP